MWNPALVCLLLLSIGLLSNGQQAVPDVKGWLGAEWGMTTAQVNDALKRPLDVAPTTGSTQIECYNAIDVPVGERKATVRLCFEQNGMKGLISIATTLPSDITYQKARDDLKSQYGPPVSETSQTILPDGSVRAEQTKWLLPSTEIQCGDMIRSGSHTVTISYLRRKPTPF
jgi:hypothetical protein